MIIGKVSPAQYLHKLVIKSELIPNLQKVLGTAGLEYTDLFTQIRNGW